MTRKTLFRIGVYGFGLFFIVLVLFVSVTRQTLYAPTAAEVQARAKLSVADRIHELTQWPPTPDHPLYPLVMIGDQIRLTLTPASQKPMLKLRYAADRLASAQKLLRRGRSSLALTTATKSTKYVLSAAEDIGEASPYTSTIVRSAVSRQILVQTSALNSMKQYFSDEQKSVIDRLLSELAATAVNFP